LRVHLQGVVRRSHAKNVLGDTWRHGREFGSAGISIAGGEDSQKLGMVPSIRVCFEIHGLLDADCILFVAPRRTYDICLGGAERIEVGDVN